MIVWQIISNSDLEELRELGSGTFGTVYHGKWRGTDVAIKRINDRCFAGKASEQERMVCVSFFSLYEVPISFFSPCFWHAYQFPTLWYMDSFREMTSGMRQLSLLTCTIPMY